MENNKKLKILNFIKYNKDKIIEIIFWLILIISLIFIFKDFIIGKLYYMYIDAGSDTVDQYYPYYINEVLGIKHEIFSIWNFNYGLGTSILNMNAWTFDIFSILLVLAGAITGAGKVQYLLVWMQILKIVIIYILSKKYMSYFLKNKLSICLASYLSAMNGYIFLWGQHYFLGTSYFYMLVMLCTIEYFLSEKNKKSMVYLALTTASLLIFSYYVAYMILLVSAIYFIFRYIYINKELKIKETCKNFGKCFYSVITGLLLSGIIFVPSCYYIITSSSRLSSGGESIITKIWQSFANSFNLEYINLRLSRLMSNNLLFINDDLNLQTASYYEWPQLFCTVFIFFFLIQWIIQDFKRSRSKKEYIFLGLKLIALYFLIFNGTTGLILNAFVKVSYRYTYVVLPFLALIVGIVWERVINKNKINIFGLIISTILSFYVWENSINQLVSGNQQIISTTLIFLIIGYIFLFFINKKNKYSNIFKYMFLCMIIITTCYDNSITTKYRKIENSEGFSLTWNKSELTNDTGKAINWIKENDDSFYRIEKNYINFSVLGDSFIEQNSSINWYNSTIDPDIDAFYKNIYPNSNIANHYKMFSLANEADLQALYLTNSKYILSKEIIDKEGIKEINKIGEVYIYKNATTNSIAKWYNKTISEDEYMQLTDEEKSKKLYEYAILNVDIDIDSNSSANVSEFNLVRQTEVAGNVSADSTGLLMLAIPNEEGWNAYIDGHLVDTYKVDYGFIGIIVPEGEHEIEFKYTTPKMKEGIILSIIGLINLMIIMFFIKDKKEKMRKYENSL